MKIPNSVRSLLAENQQKECLDYLFEYTQYHIKKFQDPSKQQEHRVFKAPVKQIFQWEVAVEIQAVQSKLDKFGQLVGLSADQLADNLTSSTKHKPKCLEEAPEQVANNFLLKNNPLVSETLPILTNLCKYLAQEMFYQPVVRMKVSFRIK